MQVGGGIVNYQLHPITQFAELTLFIRASYVVEKRALITIEVSL